MCRASIHGRFLWRRCRESPEPEFGAMQIELQNGGGKIFAGTNESQTVWESHNDEVHQLPEGFFITASSPSCEIQGMENEKGDRFGLQFHPEVNDSEFGKEMFDNFVAVCRASQGFKLNQILRFACLANITIRILCSSIAAFAHAWSKSAPTA